MKKLFSAAIMLLSFTVIDVSANQCPKALDFEIKRLGEDKVENLCQYKGKVILVVNTASKCGFTPQYEGLEKLYSEKKDQGLVVLGFPSHDFYQEPAPEQDIKDLDNICEECQKEDESVTQNLILTGFKLCKSCRTSKTVFPI